MIYFFFICFGLLILFFLVTSLETARHFRIANPLRTKFDTTVSRVEFVVSHVDLAAFLEEEVRKTAVRIGHDCVRVVLSVVRSIERSLSRIIRKLRMQQEGAVVKTETDRPFVQALSEFKDHLKNQGDGTPGILHKEG